MQLLHSLLHIIFTGKLLLEHDDNYPSNFSTRIKIARIRKAKVDSTRISCSRCGLKHKRRKCLAYGKICHKCSKPNHFSSKCKANFNSSLIKSKSYRREQPTHNIAIFTVENNDHRPTFSSVTSILRTIQIQCKPEDAGISS